MADHWISRMEARADQAREGLLDDWMLEIIGPIADLDVIDLGCGEGRFGRMLASGGARPLGVDLQPAFIARARGLGGPAERYRVGDMTTLDGVEDEAFDLAVSYISLVDVPDQVAAVRQAYRVLRPGGRFVVCNLSPMATAVDRDDVWVRDPEGHKLHYVLDDYASEGPREVRFGPERHLTNHHRMLSTTINTFIETGFTVRRVHEPLPNDEQMARVPDNGDLFRVPIFIIYDLAKPLRDSPYGEPPLAPA